MLGTTEYLFTVSSMMSVVEGVALGSSSVSSAECIRRWQAANLNPIDALRHE